MEKFSRLAGRDRKQVVDSLNARRPRAQTIEVYAKDALELPVIARRALKNEMTDRDVEDVIRQISYTGMIKSEEIATVSSEARAKAARMYVLSSHRLDEQIEPLMAFLSALAPGATHLTNDVVASRAERFSPTVPERVIECVDIIYQRVPAARRFTWVDENQLIRVLEEYVALSEDGNDGKPRTSQVPDLIEHKVALGRAAEDRNAGKPLPRFENPPGKAHRK